MRTIHTEADHDNMVMDAVNHLQNSGFSDIKAHITGYQTPDTIRWAGNPSGYIPDITANGSGKLNVFEIETRESINLRHSSSQWTLFAAYAKQNNGTFWIAVPKGSRALAAKVLLCHGITADIWEL